MGNIYQVDYRIINQWLAEIGITHSRKLSPKEVFQFLDHVGIPNNDLAIEQLGYLKKLKDAGLLEDEEFKD